MTNLKENARCVINIGSGKYEVKHAHYQGWLRVNLDADEKAEPDIVADARKLDDAFFEQHPELEGKFDAVYMSHVLEHFYPWENGVVMEGVTRLLKEDGFFENYVPDIREAFKIAQRKGQGLNAVIYEAPVGNITLHNMIYGWEGDENPWMAHHQGFDDNRLVGLLGRYFHTIFHVFRAKYEIGTLAFRQEPADWQIELFQMRKEDDEKKEL